MTHQEGCMLPYIEAGNEIITILNKINDSEITDQFRNTILADCKRPMIANFQKLTTFLIKSA